MALLTTQSTGHAAQSGAITGAYPEIETTPVAVPPGDARHV